MDDLISRNALQDALCADTEEGTFTFTEDQAEAADKIIRYVVKTLRSVTSVPAVPLDKLCEWLALNSIVIPCECCQNFVNDSCAAIGDANKPCPNSAGDWQQAITKMMEG